MSNCNVPSPEHPCSCSCHPDRACYECLHGRHKCITCHKEKQEDEKCKNNHFWQEGIDICLSCGKSRITITKEKQESWEDGNDNKKSIQLTCLMLGISGDKEKAIEELFILLLKQQKQQIVEAGEKLKCCGGKCEHPYNQGIDDLISIIQKI